ncbi:hypothetical protein [Bifidobacterium longum]
MSGDRKSYTGHGPCPYLKPKPKCAKSRALSTETDNKFFGDWKSFRVNYLKPIRRKRLES